MTTYAASNIIYPLTNYASIFFFVFKNYLFTPRYFEKKIKQIYNFL